MSRPQRHDDVAGALAEGFARHIERWALAQAAPVDAATLAAHAARALSLAIDDGHVCVDLSELAAESAEPAATLRDRLLQSGVVGTPSATGALPLIIDDDQRLYLHRHFDDERRLAARLLRAARAAPMPVSEAARARLLALFAADRGAHGVDWQQIAVALALQRRLLVISGGPGTGKTTTIARLLACIVEQQPDARIALAAPTGKAAARMAAALRERAAQLPAALRARLPTQAGTVHRLLGAHGSGARPGGVRHAADPPLPLDVLVVDEASMLDLSLAARLLDALPEHARLILLGDKDQLAAVESGAVFAELGSDASLSAACIDTLAMCCALPAAAIVPPTPLQPPQPLPSPQPHPLRDSVVWLQRSFRFDAASGIARAAAQVRDGDRDALIEQLRAGDDALRWLAEPGDALPPAVLQCLRDGYAHYLHALRESHQDVAAITQAFESFRVLCALRDGARGVAAVNRLLDAEFRAALAPGSTSPWFAGRPVMVLRNDPLLGLFNGDVGITLPDAAGTPLVHFAGSDGFRAVPAARLPPHHSAFAMTVHKAQGSEFDQVLVLLPAQQARVLSRELLYTALTRARRRVWLAADPTVLSAAVATRTQRRSGLLARLRELAAPDAAGF